MPEDKAKEFLLRMEGAQKGAKRALQEAEEHLHAIQSTLDAFLPTSVVEQLVEADVRFHSCTPFAPYGISKLSFSVDTREQVGAVWDTLTKNHTADTLRLTEKVYLKPETWVSAQPPSTLLNGPSVLPLYWHFSVEEDWPTAEAQFYLQGKIANKKGDSLVRVRVRIEQDPTIVLHSNKDLHKQSPWSQRRKLESTLPPGSVQYYDGYIKTMVVFREASSPEAGQFLSAFGVSL